MILATLDRIGGRVAREDAGHAMTLSPDLILDAHPRGGWRIRRADSQRALRRFKSCIIAKLYGQREAKRNGGRLLIVAKVER